MRNLQNDVQSGCNHRCLAHPATCGSLLSLWGLQAAAVSRTGEKAYFLIGDLL